MSFLYEHILCHWMILISSISSGSFFHLPNKPGWDFHKCLKCFSPTYLWFVLKMFSKSQGISSISVHFCFLYTWFNSCSESQSWTVNPVAFIMHYARSRPKHQVWSEDECITLTHKLGFLFPCLRDYSSIRMWLFLLKHSSEPSFVYFI